MLNQISIYRNPEVAVGRVDQYIVTRCPTYTTKLLQGLKGAGKSRPFLGYFYLR